MVILFLISLYIVAISYLIFHEYKGIGNFYAAIIESVDNAVQTMKDDRNYAVKPITRKFAVVFLITMTLLFSPFLVMLG